MSGYVKFNGQVWPAPGERMGEVEWRLRYGGATQEDVLYAACCIAAYRHLIQMQRYRDVGAKVAEINAAIDAAHAQNEEAKP